TLFHDFGDGTTGLDTRAPDGGSVTFGVSDVRAMDGEIVELMIPGLPDLGSGDRVSPAYASELGTSESLHFGTYRLRVEPARCDPSEDVVTGIFTYAHGGD